LIGGSAITLAMAFGVTLHWLYLADKVQTFMMAGIVVVSLLTPAPAESLWRIHRLNHSCASRSFRLDARTEGADKDFLVARRWQQRAGIISRVGQA